MVTGRSIHTTCRTEEAPLETIKTGKWNDIHTHIAGIIKPPSVTPFPVDRTYDNFVTFFSSGYAEWLGTQKQGAGGDGAFDKKKNAYVSANTNWIATKDTCDIDQTTFERDFCVYNSILDTTCLSHDTCHTNANSSSITTKARVQGTEAARKDAYKAGEEIVCRINALLANHPYSQCDNLTVNTSNYSIVYPTADAKVSCVTEAEVPCSTNWMDTEYNGLADNTPSTTCTPCTTCGPNQKVVGNVCTVCPAGKTSTGDHDVAAEDTTCEATICGPDEKVVGKMCERCPPGKSSTGVHDASGNDTTCEANPCASPTVTTQASGGACSQGSSISSGSSCTAQCAAGYTPSTDSLRCSLGTLSPSTFTCQANEVICADGYYNGGGSHSCHLCGGAVRRRRAQSCTSCSYGQKPRANSDMCQLDTLCRVELYEHSGFTGWRADFSAGSYDHGSFLAKGARNDQMSSFKVVGANCRATLYQHGDFAGWSRSFTVGNYDVDAMVRAGAVNDDASSIKVRI